MSLCGIPKCEDIMSFAKIVEYLNFQIGKNRTLAEKYGTENFAFFLYSILRMQQPTVVVELGTGAGTTALMAAEALKHNRKGHIWTVDDGSHWQEGALRRSCQQALGYLDEDETHLLFMERLLKACDLEGYLIPVRTHVESGKLFCPDNLKIDVLFADIASGPAACVTLLRYYLPKMASYSSIFIDRASTLYGAHLLLNYFVEQLNRGRVPLDLLKDLGQEERIYMREFVDRSSFSIVHLTETYGAKTSADHQNSRAWIRIEPLDHLHHNDVANYFGPDIVRIQSR
jgi:Methyltransferase domain